VEVEVMKTVRLVVLGVVLAAPVQAGEIYRWTDAAGGVHYANSPTAHRDGSDRNAAAPGEEASYAAPTEAGPDDATFSADVSLRRNAFERDLRATEKRLRELDTRLATLARARARNAGGSAATGGVRPPGAELRSEEEKTLADEREQLAQHALEVKAEAVKLRDEVTARLGETPAWWIDVR
jgi:hypothetical protein